MSLFGQDRKDEIERVQRRLANVIRRATVENCGNISWIEGYAAAIRAIEEQARQPAEEIRRAAQEVSASCRLDTDWASDLYQCERDQALREAGTTGVLERYCDGSRIELSGYSGGAAPEGLWGRVTLARISSDGRVEFRTFVAADDWREPAVSPAADLPEKD